jgi:AcrR family transcriptional regulator
MTSAETVPGVVPSRPLRADAQRNYEKLIAAARVAFTEDGASASLDNIARRANVGIGTLYRHFPTRPALLEAVYGDEVDALCRSAVDLAGQPPWEALVAWLHRFVGYVTTKEALAQELFSSIDHDADVFRNCRTAFYAAGDPLLTRAQQAGVVRSDTDIREVVQLVVGIAKIPSSPPDQIERVLDMALDGLRYQPDSP